MPATDRPFSLYTEVADAPWKKEHRLVHIGMRGTQIPFSDSSPNNLTFLIDVSGSMNSEDKLPLLKTSLRILVNELRAVDHVSIVVYAGAAGIVLQPTFGNHKQEIIAAIDRLQAGGSTAGE